MKNKNWEIIRDTIAAEISKGRLKPGDRLPTEQQLVEQYSVGRHSVRRAVADLSKQGLLSAEQGRGTFVSEAPKITYELGRRTRLRDNLQKQGYDLQRKLIDACIMPAPDHVADTLQIERDALVSVNRRLTLANTVPIAFGAIFHAAERFPGYLERREVCGSVSATYKSYGIDDYIRGETTLFSRQARPEEAKLLRQHPDLSVTIIRAIDTLVDGTPIACSEVVWSAARVKFAVRAD